MSEKSDLYHEPADWIVEKAGRQGATLSRRQLADWHRAGLIPKPGRGFLGGRDGTESIYPSGTLGQTIACATLMKQFDSVERVGWELWVRGFPVAQRYWREPLREAHELFLEFQSFVAAVPDAGENEPELSEKANQFIEAAGDRPEAPRRMGVARRRLGRGGFKEFLGIVLSAGIGAFETSESATSESADPKRILSRLLGVEPGRHKAAVPASPSVSVTGRAVAKNLEAMAEFLPRVTASISSEAVSEAELASARDELIFLMHSYLSVRRNEARIVAGSTPDLKLLRQLFGDLEPKEQAALLLIWLAVRDIPGWRENLDALRRSVAEELGKKT